MAQDNAATDPRVEAIFKEWDIKFRLEGDYALDSIVTMGNAQVRDVDHRAPKARIAEYASQMANGAKFPPIVITSSNVMIDGNTRVAAALTNAHKTLPAYVVTISRPEEGIIIGGALNQMGGERLTNDEARKAAVAMMDSNWADGEIARAIGRTATSVRSWRMSQTFARVAEAAGLTPDDTKHLSDTVKRKLSKIAHSAPIKTFVEESADLKVTPALAAEIVEKVAKTTSDEEASDVVTKALEDAKPDILNGKKPYTLSERKSAKVTRANTAWIKATKKRGPSGELNPDKAIVESESFQAVIDVATDMLAQIVVARDDA